ncbi:hypothetical protein OX283_012795 [Flavobacterium sp. SUN052]|uniref:hypothetical protein n=1 Tax=Flavobacterium sp. SUN052 TaxID=3002441 RepID=UPI00237D5492|nr:hypothetical protein [Flavobacterium sp. SUN052]MEC4005540.1 hypothetical protein [Flavobacterium sp. SUN052]
MKTKLFISILIVLTLFSFANQKKYLKSTLVNQFNYLSKVNEFDIDTLLIGDINNDKKIDTTFVKGPKFINNKEFYGDCKNGECQIEVSFSCNFPGLTFENAVSGFVENIGDIDKDGNSEIVIVPSWFIGCYGKIHFYTFKNKMWKFCGCAEGNICDVDNYNSRIEIIGKNKIKVKEKIWDYTLADRISKTKIILIK